MTTKLVVGPINKGITTNVLPFNIDNDAFPQLNNAYQWRGRVKRRRGDQFLNRLARYFPKSSIGISDSPIWTINTIYSTYTPAIIPEPNATITPGSIVITISSTPEIVFTDNGDGTLSGVKNGGITAATNAANCLITSNGHTLITGDTVTIEGVIGMTQLNGETYTITFVNANQFTLDVDSTLFGVYISDGVWSSPSSTNFGTINYISGVIVLTTTAPALTASTATFAYYPVLPVMGLESYVEKTEEFIQTIGFDTKYAYNISPVDPYNMPSVSYYKNPAVDATLLPGYVPKNVWTPITWNGQDYQQFWTTNYEGAFWATNGIEVPFDPTFVGMQFAPTIDITYVSHTTTTLTLTITSSPLVIGDFVFVNEWTGTDANTLNYQSGYVTAIAPNIVITFPFASLGVGPFAPGIVQYLTNRSDVTKDCIRWYDGDPTNGSVASPGFFPGKGWVNFMPPLSQGPFSVGDAPEAQYYLVGAKMMQQFKDRLVFFGPVIQTSAAGSQLYLEDTLVYSQNGTPFYNVSFTGDPVSAGTSFSPILTPINQIASAPSWFEDQTGFGGYIDSGLDEPMNTIGSNEDVIIIGFDTNKVRMVYTGNDIVPFNLFIINSELGGTSTFSTIQMDQGVIDRGNRGYTITNQSASQRIDLANPDQVFQVQNVNNGTERFTAARDFLNEWVYFTYPPNQEDATQYRFPTETFLYNYRDNSWALFQECFTTYGPFKKLTGFTWATVGRKFPTWRQWNEPWDTGNSNELQESVIGGTPQGFVMFRAQGTADGASIAINNIAGSIVTSPDHCLDNNNFIEISGVLGTIGQDVNGKIFRVQNPTLNNFTLSPAIVGTGTYLGGGVIKRLYVPFIQSKQFPIAWSLARKTRIGVQQYLLSFTPNAQITLYIYLSTANDTPFNFGDIVPAIEPENDGLIYSSVLLTCPESTNLGLTTANTNLQQLNLIGSNGQSQNPQQQIWHRINTSLIGDVVQVGFTISPDQMRSYESAGNSVAITGASQAISAVILTTANFGINTMVKITGILGMTQLNFDTSLYNIYRVIASTPTDVTLEVDSSGFDTYISGGFITPVANRNSTAEVELHAMILDLSASMLLS